MGVDRGPCQGPFPQLDDPGLGEGRTQANCGVWLTATGRGHRDTQPPTNRTRRGDTCPGPVRENSSDNVGMQRASTRTNQHRAARINQTTTRHTSECTAASKRQSPALPSLPALHGGYAVNILHSRGDESESACMAPRCYSEAPTWRTNASQTALAWRADVSHRAPEWCTAASHRTPAGRTGASHRAPTWRTDASHKVPAWRRDASHRAHAWRTGVCHRTPAGARMPVIDACMAHRCKSRGTCMAHSGKSKIACMAHRCESQSTLHGVRMRVTEHLHGI